MIDHIHIENFRSIRNLDLSLGQINALIGRNNVGKSNIIYAIKLLLDEKWPANAITEEDICNYEKGLECKIELYFDTPIIHNYYGTDLTIYGFKLTLDKSRGPSFIGIDEQGSDVLTQYNKPISISNEIRLKVPIVYIGVDRDLARLLVQNDWGLLNRILDGLSNKSQSNNNTTEEFKLKISAAMNVIKDDLKDIESDMETTVKEHTGVSSVSLEFKEPDLRSFYRSLGIHIKENSVFEWAPALSMGTGIQSMVAISLIRAYRAISGSKSILLIEEPEIYLHPHARRHFYGILDKIAAEGIQIIYTTHSTEFVDLYNFDRVNIVNKNWEMGTHVNQGRNITVDDDSKTRIKMQTEMDNTRNELFFSEKVFLVEGITEKNSMPYFFKLNQINMYKENISIVDVGGKQNIIFFSTILKSFKIPFVVLLDSDSDAKDLEYTQKLNEKICDHVGKDCVFFADPNLEKVLKLSVGAKDSKPRIVFDIASSLNSKNQVPEVINSAIKKLNNI